jgi:integrase
MEKSMLKRTKYQEGTLILEKRQKGSDVWVYRYYGVDTIGRPTRPKVRVGTKAEYPSRAHARRAVAALELDINVQTIAPNPRHVTVQELADHYKAHELSADRRSKTEYTCDVYRHNIDAHIVSKWGTYLVVDLKTAVLEDWLHSLVLADGTKAKIRNVFSAILNHGIRHELATSNPITGPSRGAGVRQSAKRKRTPDVLTSDELRSILAELTPLHRVIVLMLASTGLRFSELRGLQWQDLDYITGTMKLTRGFVKNYITPLKSAASRKSVPLHPSLMTELANMRAESPYNQPEDWIFASVRAGGKVPIWGISLMENHILPAVKRAKVLKQVGWHTFRHSLATTLASQGEDIKTVQETMRHANSKITMDIYAQAVGDNVRLAHERMFDSYNKPVVRELVRPLDPDLSSSVSVSY